MSVNRRRWSNKFLQSIKEFSSKEKSKSTSDLMVENMDRSVDISIFDSLLYNANVPNIKESELNTNQSNQFSTDTAEKSVSFNCSWDLNKEMLKDTNCPSDAKNVYKSCLNSTLNKSMENSQEKSSQKSQEKGQRNVWDTLMELEHALSPVNDHESSIKENNENYPSVLNRLSQKFKETPTKFTEKLVSIIEDSVVLSESFTKQNADDTSETSLNKMTEEFRKLCKFIEDESMPEWAPSLMNISNAHFNKSETLKNENCMENTSVKTPKNVNDTVKHTSILFKNFTTPENKIKSNGDSPIKRFTPSADKSFEFWENVCEIMCDNKSGSKKKMRRSTSVPELTKQSMNEMLTICERQMASLDDSTVVIRNSEPCKKIDRDIKIMQTPRSKSESKILTNFQTKLSLKDSDESENEKTVTEKNNRFSDEYYLYSDKEEEIEYNRKSQPFSPLKSNDELLIQESDDNDDPDCSLLIELAKRRQRCLDTAKLMMEIDKNDPITNGKNIDNKCYETLYKLGIQDETLAENENNSIFLNTLGHCLEYKRYVDDKSKPLLNMLHKIHSPENMKNKTISKLKLKTPIRQLKTPTNSTVSGKKTLERKSCLTNVNSKKMTTKYNTKNISNGLQQTDNSLLHLPSSKIKVTPCSINKTKLNISNNKQTQTSSKVTTKTKTASKQSLQSVKRNLQKETCEKQVNFPKIKSEEPLKNPLRITNHVDENTCNNSCMSPYNENSPRSISSPKMKFFLTPDKNTASSVLRRKKPVVYFPDTNSEKTSQKTGYEDVKSPINLYIHGTDTDLIRNVQGRMEDFLLTPISHSHDGKSPKLKFNRSPKENRMPFINFNENKIPTVRYQSAEKVRMINNQSSYSPSPLTPNSRTKKLLQPIENNIVIRHEGRIVEYNPKSNLVNPETSIRVQKTAGKIRTLQKNRI